jgi:hypothetical protein
MEYLPNDFIQLAKDAGLTTKQVKNVIGENLFASDITIETQSKINISDSEKEILKNTLVSESIFSLIEITKRTVYKDAAIYNSLNGFTALQINKTNTISLELFSSKNEFINAISKPFINELDIASEFKKIENLNQFEWQVIVACIELFLEKYPTPNAKWVPDELLIISAELIETLFNEIEFKANASTWWKHWIAISNQDAVNTEDISNALVTLSLKELLGDFKEFDGEHYYFIGQNLLWLIRSIAWWDKGFALSNKQNGTNIFVFQASSLFALLNTKNEYHLLNINGEQLPKLIDFFLELDNSEIEKVEAQEKIEEKNEVNEQLESKSTKKFCTNCGTKIINSAKFCVNCGTKL